jgi:hypothetical protein
MFASCSPFVPAERQAAVSPDLAMLTFIRRYADTPLRWEIIAYFAQHPEEPLTSQQVAQGVRRSIRLVQIDLDDLVLLGLLERRRSPLGSQYTLADDPLLRYQMARFRERFVASS